MPRNPGTAIQPADVFAPAPVQGRAASQGTVIEQTRAIAEVQAMVAVAQQFPRDESRAYEAMRAACQRRALAERAFFRFPRAGGAVTGATIHLARELARIWGNINYGVTELKRDEGVSEMQAHAWDVQTNSRNATIFISPHMRDKRGGAEDLTELRDVYENNANMGARRVRECIFAVLPRWFVEEAQDICRHTLENGDGEVPVAVRITKMVDAFATIGVTEDQIEAKLGAPRARWTPVDLAHLGVVYKSIRSREVRLEDEFTPRRTTAADVLGDKPAPEPKAAPAPDRDWYAELESAGDDEGKLRDLYDAAEAASADPGILASISAVLDAIH